MRRRTGFTLVEVLVSMALILFIMSILSAAFVAATQSFSDLKAAGDLAEKLRAATGVLHSDLAAYHVVTGAGNRNLKDLWAPPYDPTHRPPPPIQGFFRLFQGSPPQPLAGPPTVGSNFVDGTDSVDNLPSYISTNHVLHYTIILPVPNVGGIPGTNRSDFLSAIVPAGSPLTSGTNPAYPYPDEEYMDTRDSGNNLIVYNSQMAEVAVFLSPETDPSTGQVVTTDGTPNGTPLFGLFRRQFLTVPASWTGNSSVPGTPANQASYAELSNFVPNGQANLYFNTMLDLTMPVKRFAMDRSANIPQTPDLAGLATAAGYQPAGNASDLLLNDVISFDVQLKVTGAKDFGTLFQLTDPTAPLGISFPSKNPQFVAAKGPRVFDTWSAASDTTTRNANYDYSTTWDPTLPPTNATVPLYLDSTGTTTINVRAVQITIRVWDFKTKKTRQVTMVQQV